MDEDKFVDLDDDNSSVSSYGDRTPSINTKIKSETVDVAPIDQLLVDSKSSANTRNSYQMTEARTKALANARARKKQLKLEREAQHRRDMEELNDLRRFKHDFIKNSQKLETIDERYLTRDELIERLSEIPTHSGIVEKRMENLELELSRMTQMISNLAGPTKQEGRGTQLDNVILKEGDRALENDPLEHRAKKLDVSGDSFNQVPRLSAIDQFKSKKMSLKL